MNIDWHQHIAAVWRHHSQTLKPVKRSDPINLSAIQGVDLQKTAIIDNTEHFLAGKTANHALLWGARGTGKSSLIKALLNEFHAAGLRMIQVDKEELAALPQIMDELETADDQYRFIIFCDDLSFDEGDDSYKPLKSVLEGGLELPPENVRVYATSNRRHLLPEKQSENQISGVVDGEVHYADSLEDKLALSDRFGLTLSFYPVNWDNYFTIVDSLFESIAVDQQTIRDAAKAFAMSRGSHSGRTAKQFYQFYAASLEVEE